MCIAIGASPRPTLHQSSADEILIEIYHWKDDLDDLNAPTRSLPPDLSSQSMIHLIKFELPYWLEAWHLIECVCTGR